ncbi:hypothetical protein ABT288_02660 [Streptomyces sp. NPDC001093]|uniref:hypothetical protein n=1 Tax=Streptomyces sp. NPDC001093 TaxID=3154376 RepID=UPI00331DE5A9
MTEHGHDDASQFDADHLGPEELARKISQLQREIGQLQEAVISHAVINQATNIKLRKIAGQIVGWPASRELSADIRQALEAALSQTGSA